MLKQVVIIEEKNHKVGGKKAIVLGSAVTVEISGKKHSYTVVGEWEADPDI